MQAVSLRHTRDVPITTDPERLARVASELGAAFADAERTGRVRLPVIQPRDTAGLVMAMHEALDEQIEARSADAAAAGQHVACAAGCSACCVAPVLVGEGEAVTVAEWLALPEQAAVRARFDRTYPTWQAAVGATIDAFARASSSDEQRAAAVAYKQRNVMCAFNHEGLCTIYAARPARCRKAHALGTSANCGIDGSGQVSYFEHAATEITFQEQERMRVALHHALRPNKPAELLCAAVHRLLDASVGRNAPCLCGSGEKYKRCCGR